MRLKYKTRLNVSPFLIVPIALTNQEATVALGPIDLVERKERLIRSLYSYVAEHNSHSRIIAQILPYGDDVIIANTIRTKVPDADSGRNGLKLTYGASIHRAVFVQQADVCTRTFGLLDQYFKRAFGAAANVEGADRIVARFQEKDTTFDFIGDEAADEMLNSFESEFSTSDKYPLPWTQKVKLRFRCRKILKLHTLKPTSSIEDVQSFWNSVDGHLWFCRRGTLGDHIGSQKMRTISLQIPASRLAILKNIAKSRGMSDQELLAFYIEQESDKDLAMLVSDRVLEATAKVLARYVESEDKVLAIVGEIRGEAITQVGIDPAQSP